MGYNFLAASVFLMRLCGKGLLVHRGIENCLILVRIQLELPLFSSKFYCQYSIATVLSHNNKNDCMQLYSDAVLSPETPLGKPNTLIPVIYWSSNYHWLLMRKRPIANQQAPPGFTKSSYCRIPVAAPAPALALALAPALVSCL